MNRFTSKKLVLTASLLLIASLVFPFTSPTVMAQSSKGIVVGTITDPTGAAISGGTVRLTNTSTNVSRETVSSSEGTFRLDAVDPGTYKVEVRASGFKVAELDNVMIAAAQTTDTSFTLEVGSAAEVVNVSPDSNVTLQKQDGARTSTLDPRQIVDLPVAGLQSGEPGVYAAGRDCARRACRRFCARDGVFNQRAAASREQPVD